MILYMYIVLKERKSDKNDKNKKKVKMIYPQVVSVSSVVVCGTKSLLVYS